MVRVLLTILFIASFSAEAKLVTFGADEISIAIKYQQMDGSKESVPTYLRFPRAIARVDNATMFSVKAASATGVQPDYRELELKPRVNEGTQRVEVLLNDGTVVRLKLRITTNADVPVSYDFEPKRVHEESKSSAIQGQVQIADLSLMRAILQGDTPQGFSKRSYSMSVSCSGNGPSARLLRVFEGSQFKVFQLEVSNGSSKKSFLIKEENITFKIRDLSRSPLIHVQNNLLNPIGKGQSSTIVTILSDPSTNVNKMRVCDLGDQVEVIEAKVKVQR